MRIKKEKFFVLKTFPFSEAHLVVRGLTSRGGKMSFKALGALKSRRRFSGCALEPCSFVEAEYSSSPSSSLAVLRETRILRDFRGLRSDYQRITLALYFAGLMESVIQENQEDSPELFHLLGNALLEAETTLYPDALKLFFQVKFLFLQGALPEPQSFQSILTAALRDHKSFGLEAVQSAAALMEKAVERYLQAP